MGGMLLVVCPYCWAETDVAEPRCGACDERLDLSCAACGAANHLGDRFCGDCGQPLAAVDEPPAAPAAGTERDELRTITVMMADLDGFTQMAEILGRERQSAIMNAVYERLAGEHIVRSFDGYIDKYLDGDIMALFGAPIAHEDSPERAVRAAVRMHTELAALHADGTIPPEAPLRLRVGLNTGPVRVGGVGAGGRMEYTAMGDTVNLAARLMTAADWGQSLISTSTERRTRGSFELTTLPAIFVKGKSQPVELWSVDGERRRAARIELAVSHGLSRLVGRDDLLAILTDGWAQAQEGQGGAYGVRGEAGLGKSRLVFELGRTVDPATSSFYEGRCLSYGSALSYLPVREVLGQWLGIEDLDDAATRWAKIERAADVTCELCTMGRSALGFLLGLEPTEEAWVEAEPQARREALRATFATALISQAQERPTVVFIDDCQWLDADSAELIDALVRTVAGTRVLVLLAYRPDFEPPWEDPFLGLDLWRLTMEETGEVVGSLMAARGLVEAETTVDRSMAEAVWHKTQGNPFFIDQLVTALTERAATTGTPTIDFRRGRLLITEEELGRLAPDSVEEILLARMDKLPSEPRNLLQAASVAMLGRRFRRSALQQVLDRDDLAAPLAQLVEGEFIHLEERGEGDEEYAFDHALARDVAYGALLRTERRRLHGRMGEFIEQRYAGSLEAYLDDLSLHFYNSTCADKALKYLPRSAARAAAVYSNQQAIVQYKRAIEKAGELGADANNQRLEVLVGLTTVQTLVGDAELVGYLEQRLILAQSLDDEEEQINALFMLARRHSEMGEFGAAQGYFEQARQAFERLGDWTGVRDTLFGVGNLLYLQGQTEGALEQFQAALDVQLEHLEFDPFGQWVAYNNLAAAYEGLGRYADLLAACETCTELLGHMEPGDPLRVQLETYTYGNQGQAQRNLGALDEATEAYRTALARAQATGERAIEAEVRYWLGQTLLEMGDVATAARELDEALALARESQHARWEGGALIGLAELARVNGDLDLAASRLAEARALAERTGELAASEEADLAESRLALARGDATAAEALAVR
ncbi:MAG TPA: hypothetical protein DCZ72_15220, partial [Armatimonadetes bacterium]|nr:hypothetical protein [Armatimonadota bacterium]